MGQWNNLESYLSTRRSKKVKDIKPLNAIKEFDQITQYIKNIQNSTRLLKTLEPKLFSKVLQDFKLPVSFSKSIKI